MEPMWRETFLMHAQTQEFKDKLEQSKAIIKNALSQCREPYIAFSGGKDSTALLSLVLQKAPNILIFHWDFGRYYLPRSIEKEIHDIAFHLGGKNLLVESSREYEVKKRQAKAFYKSFFGRVLPKLQVKGYDLAFIGLRMQESIIRKIKLRGGHFEQEKEMVNCYPLRNWSYLDVWAYLISNNIGYLSYYDIYAQVIPLSELRFATFFDPEFDKLGSSNVDGILMWKFRNL